jgi:hypothetical protein
VMIWSVILQPSAFLASAGQERIGAEWHETLRSIASALRWWFGLVYNKVCCHRREQSLNALKTEFSPWRMIESFQLHSFRRIKEMHMRMRNLVNRCCRQIKSSQSLAWIIADFRSGFINLN